MIGSVPLGRTITQLDLSKMILIPSVVSFFCSSLFRVRIIFVIPLLNILFYFLLFVFVFFVFTILSMIDELFFCFFFVFFGLFSKMNLERRRADLSPVT